MINLYCGIKQPRSLLKSMKAKDLRHEQTFRFGEPFYYTLTSFELELIDRLIKWLIIPIITEG